MFKSTSELLNYTRDFIYFAEATNPPSEADYKAFENDIDLLIKEAQRLSYEKYNKVAIQCQKPGWLAKQPEKIIYDICLAKCTLESFKVYVDYVRTNHKKQVCDKIKNTTLKRYCGQVFREYLLRQDRNIIAFEERIKLLEKRLSAFKEGKITIRSYTCLFNE